MKNSVSIITITQLNRFNCLKILKELIENQLYDNIIEWIIIDNSKNIDDYNTNIILIKNLLINFKYNINLIPYESHSNMELLIKKGLNLSSSDISIIMDDDDYYFNTCISHCVDKMSKSNLSIGGLESQYVYDLIIKKIFIIKYNKSIIAYKKNHNVNDNIELLMKEKTVLKIIHNENTYFPKIITLGGSFNGISNNIVQQLENEFINYIIPDSLLNRYINIFINNDTVNYDIVYLTGGIGISWNPSDQNLGGSEQGVVELSENWVLLGKSVIVYGNFSKDQYYNGVYYSNWINFPFEKKLKTLIIWRKPGLLLLMNNDFSADNTIIDFHDNFFVINDLESTKLQQIFDKINFINIKSKYHYECFIDFLKSKNINNNYNNKCNIIENGVRINHFKKNNNIIRNPFRFCYCSSYDRGLEDIILKIWPIIYNKEPTAELHIYYGMDYIYDDDFKIKMKQILSSTGVMDHGRQSMDIIIREKYLSTFHLYINNSISEIDCISIKESLVTGCIPIISNFGVFKERDGLHYNWNSNDEELCKYIANDIILKMNDMNYIINYRNNIINSDTIISWYSIANKWLKYIN